jgi:hypothetical protein
MCHSHDKVFSHETCCCGCGPITRHFISEREKQERLEKYKAELKNEIAGIEERIQELKRK